MLLVLAIVPLVAAFAGLLYTLINFHRLRLSPLALPHCRDRLTVDGIAEIEKHLANLKRVIVLAHRIEKPLDDLSEAVEYNFQRGVRYLFLVSQSQADQEVQGYYQIFETLAKIVIYKTSAAKQIKDLVDIQQLPYDWDDYPYIFYQVEDATGASKTIAFRGDQLREGIADAYVRVEPTYAHTIARSVLADAPRPLAARVRIEEFEVAPDSVRFERRVTRTHTDTIQ
mgnify:CR=1 FL=1